MPNEPHNKLLTTADLILLTGLIFLLPFLYISVWSQDLQADTVKIWSSKSGFQNFSLSHDQEIQIEGERGKSILEIRDGKIRFVTSSCANKICVRSGWHSHAGAFTACLPNKISLEIIGKEKYDSINF